MMPTSAAEIAAAQFDYTLARITEALGRLELLPWIVVSVVVVIGLAWLGHVTDDEDARGAPPALRPPSDCHG